MIFGFIEKPKMRKPLPIILTITLLLVISFWGFFGQKRDTSYKIVLVGDSMTQVLGENLTEFRERLQKYYPDKKFEIDNYGYGSTNILSVPERLEKETSYGGKIRPAILQKEFDIIFIESMGHNPLSHLPLEEGLKKQDEALTKLVESINSTHPNSVIVFVATIAPNTRRYGEGAVVLMPEKRLEWANERKAYIENHIKFAQKNNIPLLNIYEKSFKDGDGNIDLISGDDFIHPSTTGVYFISQEMADFLYNRRIIPH